MTHTYRAGVIGRIGQDDYGHALDEAFVGLSNVQLIALTDPDAVGRDSAMRRTGAERGMKIIKRGLKKRGLTSYLWLRVGWTAMLTWLLPVPKPRSKVFFVKSL